VDEVVRVEEPDTEHVVDHCLSGDLRQVFIDQQPLIMPERDLAGDEELVVDVGQVRVLGRRVTAQVDVVQVAQHPVVEQHVRTVQAGDHEIFVVAWVREGRGVGAVTVAGPGHILMHPARTDPQLRADRAIGVRHIQLGADARPAAEH
jgi:hypothetical protein